MPAPTAIVCIFCMLNIAHPTAFDFTFRRGDQWQRPGVGCFAGAVEVTMKDGCKSVANDCVAKSKFQAAQRERCRRRNRTPGRIACKIKLPFRHSQREEW
uniref:Secreted protein n=1 Tax=Chrysotila carterae TaxID=13221 RepID=A0A6S9STG1_CHRCT|mmetsp:Transcript_11825/g.23038  ORF Transcript_11825/g.23038 Transcript_11825/m.23038 type:complete len:100 (+) Transcript_11825:277-576(+)